MLLLDELQKDRNLSYDQINQGSDNGSTTLNITLSGRTSQL